MALLDSSRQPITVVSGFNHTPSRCIPQFRVSHHPSSLFPFSFFGSNPSTFCMCQCKRPFTFTLGMQPDVTFFLFKQMGTFPCTFRVFLNPWRATSLVSCIISRPVILLKICFGL